MCFDDLDMVGSMRAHPMLCFMCPSVTGVSWIHLDNDVCVLDTWIQLDNESTSYVVFHVSKCYWCWSWIQLDNENTSVCVSCVQVLLVVVAVRVSGVYY